MRCVRHMSKRVADLMPRTSTRIEATDVPCIVQMQQMLRGKTDVLSLAQGIVHWAPPEEAVAVARAAVGLPETSLYGADDGLPDLRAALKKKLATENGIVASEVMVTSGANQARRTLIHPRRTLIPARAPADPSPIATPATATAALGIPAHHPIPPYHHGRARRGRRRGVGCRWPTPPPTHDIATRRKRGSDAARRGARNSRGPCAPHGMCPWCGRPSGGDC